MPRLLARLSFGYAPAMELVMAVAMARMRLFVPKFAQIATFGPKWRNLMAGAMPGL